MYFTYRVAPHGWDMQYLRVISQKFSKKSYTASYYAILKQILLFPNFT